MPVLPTVDDPAADDTTDDTTEHDTSDDAARADLTYVLARLLVPGDLTADEPEVVTALAVLGERLRSRLAGSAPDAVATFGRPDSSAEALGGAIDQLSQALAADPALAVDATVLADEATRTDARVGAVVLGAMAWYQDAHDRPRDVLATADRILRDTADDASALYLSAVALRRLDRPAEALIRLRALSALATIDADDQALLAGEFLELGERDLARGAAEAAERLAAEQPLSDGSAENLAYAWVVLDDRARALTVLRPQLAHDGPPTPADVRITEFAVHTLLHEGDPTAAAQLVRRLERRGADLADHPLLRLGLGRALLELGSSAEALPLLDADLVDLVPEHLRGLALLARGGALLGTDPVDAAAVLTDAAASLEGDDAAVATLLRGLSLVSAQRGVEARQAIGCAARRTTPTSNPVLRGRIALWQAVTSGDDAAQFAEMARLADELLPPEWPERVLLTLARAQRLANDEPDRAIALLDALDTPPPGLRPEVLRTRATALVAQDHPREAARVLEPLLTGPGAVVDRVLYATSLLQTREPDAVAAARAQLAAIADADLRGTPLVMTCIQIVAGAVGRLGGDETLEAMLTRLAGPSTAVAADFFRAVSLMLRGRLAAAVALLRTYADPAAEEPDPLAWIVAAQARQLDGRTDVLAAVDRAVELEPGAATSPLVRPVRLLEAAGNGDVAAIDAIGPPTDTPWGRVFHRLLRGVALAATGRSAEALTELTAAADQAAGLASPLGRQWRVHALSQKAMVLLRQDDPAGAADALRTAEPVAVDLPEGAPARLLLALVMGLLHMRRGEYAEADAAFAAAGPTDGLPDELAFSVEYMRGTNWHLAGADAAEDARCRLGRAQELHPDDVDVNETLGAVHLDLEDPAAALDCVDRALRGVEKPDQRLRLLREAARAYRQLGRLETALATAREAVAHDVTDARSWLSLGLAQLGLGRNAAAAVAFRRGRQVQPSAAAPVAAKLVVGLTTALIEGGHSDEALQILGTAPVRRMAADEPQLAQNHAVALYRAGRRDEAAAALRRAGRSRQADDLAAAHARHSWLGFWFGGGVSPRRAVLGATLMLLAAATLGLVVVDGGRVGWLGWAATDTTRLLAPLVVVVVLFLLPVLTKIKVGDVELEQPAAATPGEVELRTVNWEAIEQQVARVATRSQAGALRVGGPPVGSSISLARAGIAQAAGRSAARPSPAP